MADTLFRIYEPWELGADGYPRAWHGPLATHDLRPWCREHGSLGDHGYGPDALVGVKDLVRIEAEHRCIRCGHPYRVGESGVWARGRTLPVKLQPEQPLDALFDVEHEPGDMRIESRALLETHWSRCDERCTHGGPIRYVHDGEKPNAPFDDGPAREYVMRIKRDGLACHVEAAWRILTVHHLNERKYDLRWHNLVSLCQRCHLNVQRRVIMDRAYPWDHSEWFRPYVAAFYAVKYLGEEPSREETTERLDELLNLGKREESVERMAL